MIPAILESRWLLNIAYMTTGGYPQHVPPQFLLKVQNDDSMHPVKPFRDVAANMGLNYKCMAGGCIVDDFNNDSYPDIVIKQLVACQNPCAITGIMPTELLQIYLILPAWVI